MVNNTKIKVSAKIESMLKEIDYEGRESGYWAYSEKGFKFESTDSHTSHEYTQKGIVSEIKKIVPCECEQCK